jgi:putative transposon-encoded protein
MCLSTQLGELIGSVRSPGAAKLEIQVQSQSVVRQCPAATLTVITAIGTVTAIGNSVVTAIGNSVVTAIGNSVVTAIGTVTAIGNSAVTAIGTVTAVCIGARGTIASCYA